jgi:hypothetical protein
VRLRLTVAAIAAATATAAGGWVLARDSAPAAPRVTTPTPAQLAARTRLADELEMYGCSCGGHRPPATAYQSP